MDFLHFIFRNRDQIFAATLEHLWLVGAAMFLAVLIGIPLGIVAARRPWLGKPIIGAANVAETIPSLALFGFLLPVPWGGARRRAPPPPPRAPRHRNHRRGRQSSRRRARHGNDGQSDFDSRRTAAGVLLSTGGRSRRDRPHDSDRDDCRSHRCRRARRIHFSRSGDG